MANVSGTEINLKPTDGMKAEARRYKEWTATRLDINHGGPAGPIFYLLGDK